MVDYFVVIQPFIAAVIVGLSFAFVKYRAAILDPTKESPEGFDWKKAASTTIIAVVVSIVYTAMGNPLDVTGIEAQMAVYGGFTFILDPIVNAVVRYIQDRKVI